MTIKLPSGQDVLIDDSDYELVSKYKWHIHADGYAIAEYGNRRLGNRKTVLMHRLIMNTPNGMDTDHINRNRLDNRRMNLRVATRTQNNFNSGVHSNNKSGHRGVSWTPRIGRWRAYIGGKNRIELGHFKTIDEAIKARQEAEKIYIS